MFKFAFSCLMIFIVTPVSAAPNVELLTIRAAQVALSSYGEYVSFLTERD